MNIPLVTISKKKFVVLTSLILFLFLNFDPQYLSAQNETFSVEGKVFIDENQNGKLDAHENGKQGVLVSNGIDVVRSNESGSYKITITCEQHIFPVLPSGYLFEKGSSWWFDSTDLASKKNINFGLIPTSQTDTTKLLAIGDVQVGNSYELDYAGRTVFRELMSKSNYDMSIFLGDLVNDEPELMEPIDKMIDGLDNPAWTVYGNHDRNFDLPQSEQGSSYKNYFGPRNYAFYKNDILFIGLNSLRSKGKYGYQGRYGDNELNFVHNLLATIQTPKQIVIFQHIPLQWIRNKDQLITTLEKYFHKKVLVLSGHTHTFFQNFYDTDNISIHEVNVGATSGHWWTGQKNWQGNPLALMKDGTPRGYLEISFNKRSYHLEYKGIGLDQDKQMSIWFGENIGEITQKVDAENREIYINVYTGSEKSKVKMRIDKGNWITLKKVHEIDPFVANIKQLQESEKYPNKISKKSPYLESESKHLWKGQIPKDLKKGMYKLEVEVDDPFGTDMKDTTWFWIE